MHLVYCRFVDIDMLLTFRNGRQALAALQYNNTSLGGGGGGDVSILVRLQTPDWVELVEHELNLVKSNTAALFNATSNSLLGEDFNIPSMSFDVDSGDDDSEVAAALGQQQQDPFNIQQAAFNNPNRAGALLVAELRLHLYTRCFVCNVHVHVYAYSVYMHTCLLRYLHVHVRRCDIVLPFHHQLFCDFVFALRTLINEYALLDLLLVMDLLCLLRKWYN